MDRRDFFKILSVGATIVAVPVMVLTKEPKKITGQEAVLKHLDSVLSTNDLPDDWYDTAIKRRRHGATFTDLKTGESFNTTTEVFVNGKWQIENPFIFEGKFDFLKTANHV